MVVEPTPRFMSREASFKAEKPAPFHPVYIVTNTQIKVRVLYGQNVYYSAWVTLFKRHARGYNVLKHDGGTKALAENDTDFIFC